ncbi:MAG: hypothetical protein ACFFCP_02895 [Promethearchaeota archaeon]
MNTALRTRKIAAALLIVALFAPFFISVGVVPPRVSAVVNPINPMIVVDMSHGQYSSYVIGEEDAWLMGNLTAMGFNVVFAYGGINATILADATGLLLGAIYGTTAGFAQAEIDAIRAWFNIGKKFLWVGSDSDYAGYSYINSNMSLVLDEIGSHVYPEPISISDAYSNCNASYRVVANRTSTDPFVAKLGDGIDSVLMHGPTSLYGSSSGQEGTDVVALETDSIPNVYPVLYYGASATMTDSDLVPPLAHNDGDQGEFVAMTVEVNAGTDNNSVIVVSGASPYGDYQPMYTTEYYTVPLDGNILVDRTINWGMEYAAGPLIVIDMTHGQYSSYVIGEEDTWLVGNLTAMGYQTIYAWGGLNDSILARARGLLLGAIYGTTAGFAQAEIDAVADWFNAGNKFLWVGSDSDYAGYAYINNNMSLVLEAVGSHVYPEPISVSDAYSNCNASYRVVANSTSTDPFVADLGDGIDSVLMHGPTTLYGSTSATPDQDAVALETVKIDNVYPVLYYGASATITDSDLVPPLAHNDGDQGKFVAMTVEIGAGTDGSGVIVVSGASPYGDYQPMYTTEYYTVPLDGNILVDRTIDWGMNYAMNPYSPTQPGFVIDPVILMGIAGAVIVVIIIVVVMKRR